jgi:hypothetical protein
MAINLNELEDKNKKQNTSNSSSTNSSSSNTQKSASVFNSNSSNSSNSSSSSRTDYSNNSYSYFRQNHTTVNKGSSTTETVGSLNKALTERNEEEKSESVIHGMSDAEYEEYQKYMYENYGITLERGYNYGHFQNVAVAMGESCSQGTRFSAMCKSAQSYDSVLDLVLDAKLQAAIADIFKGDTDPNWDRLASSGNAGRLLRDYGIKVVKCADRQWCFSLVDEKGNVIQDEDGHLAQVYKNDYLMPDGQCQQNEVHVSAALDAMGFDCWSVLDLSAEEYEMVKEMAMMKNSELGSSSNFTGDNELAIRNEVLGTYDQATRTWSKAKRQDNSAWVNGTYTDKVTGEQMSAKKRYSQFMRDRDAGKYRGLKGNDYGSFTGDSSKYMSHSDAPAGGGTDGGFTEAQAKYFEENANAENRIHLTKVQFEAKVEQTMQEKDCGRLKAEEIVGLKYYYDRHQGFDEIERRLN